MDIRDHVDMGSSVGDLVPFRYILLAAFSICMIIVWLAAAAQRDALLFKQQDAILACQAKGFVVTFKGDSIVCERPLRKRQ